MMCGMKWENWNWMISSSSVRQSEKKRKHKQISAIDVSSSWWGECENNEYWNFLLLPSDSWMWSSRLSMTYFVHLPARESRICWLNMQKVGTSIHWWSLNLVPMKNWIIFCKSVAYFGSASQCGNLITNWFIYRMRQLLTQLSVPLSTFCDRMKLRRKVLQCSKLDFQHCVALCVNYCVHDKFCRWILHFAYTIKASFSPDEVPPTDSNSNEYVRCKLAT